MHSHIVYVVTHSCIVWMIRQEDLMNLSVPGGRDINDIGSVSVTRILTLALSPFVPVTDGRDSRFGQRQVEARFKDIG